MTNTKQSELRKKRQEAEAAQQTERRQDQLARAVVLSFLVVFLTIGGIVLATGPGSDKKEPPSSGDIARLLQGIPQTGTTLGNPNAPVTLVEFADLRCPFCAEVANSALREVIAGPVRDGKAKIEYRHWSIIPGSIDVAKGMYAASEQGRAWHFIEEFYANQGSERDTITYEKVRETARKAGIPDMSMWEEDYSNPAYDRLLLEVDRQAGKLSLGGTPAFAILRNGDLVATDLSAGSGFDEFQRVIEEG